MEGIETGVKGQAVNFMLTRLGRRRNHCARHLSVLRPEVARFYAELLERIRIGQSVSVVAKARHVDATVEVEADHRNATVNPAVDNDLGGRHTDHKIWATRRIALHAGAVARHTWS